MRRLLCALVLASAPTLFAQNQVNAIHSDTTAQPMAADANPSFEVASIRPNDTPGRIGFVLVNIQGEHYYARKVSPLDLIKFAYRLQAKQVIDLPSWATEKTYDISAVMQPEGHPSGDQLRTMLQKLLADRFKATTHTDQRVMPVYVLAVAKGGSKLKPSDSPNIHDLERPVAGGMEFVLYGSATSGYANYLQQALVDRPVVDQTGLTGKFDFDVTFMPDETMFGGRFRPSPEALANAAPNFFTAIQEQLGLKLTPEKVSATVLVVDHIEQPSEN
jgi:uncharacterized protein (TIGR03435 family)